MLLPLLLPQDLVCQVVAFLNSTERRAAGFSLDACVFLKIPPAPLPPHDAFIAQLTDLQQRRLSTGGVNVFKKDESVLVSIDFPRTLPLDHALDHVPIHQLIMYVRPRAEIVNASPFDFVSWSFSPPECRNYIFHPEFPEVVAIQVPRFRKYWTRRRGCVLFK